MLMLALQTSPTQASISLTLDFFVCSSFELFWLGITGKLSVTNLSLGSKSLVMSEWEATFGGGGDF
jgi:hypothetical protein